MKADLRDLGAGALFVAIGLSFALTAWFKLRVGEALAMGPGFFPVMLGAVLVGFGAIIALNALGRQGQALRAIPWFGIAMVLGAIAFFAETVRGLGMAPALFIATLMAGLSSRRLGVLPAAVVAACMTAFCVGVFIYALGLPYRPIGPWLIE